MVRLAVTPALQQPASLPKGGLVGRGPQTGSPVLAPLRVGWVVLFMLVVAGRQAQPAVEAAHQVAQVEAVRAAAAQEAMHRVIRREREQQPAVGMAVRGEIAAAPEIRAA